MDDATCAVVGCDRPIDRRGWCSAHYSRWKRTGDVGADIPVRQLTPSLVAHPPGTQCRADGCGKPARALGWCSGHYERQRQKGDVKADVPLAVRARTFGRYAPDARCAVDDCQRQPHSNGWCKRHYERWRIHGDPLHVPPDFRTRLESHIDRSGGPDACHPWTAGQVPDGYGWVKVGKTSKLAHMAVWELENGPKPRGMDLDHECHNLAVAEGRCLPGICGHRLCCNLRHIALKSRTEHVNIAEPWQFTRRWLGVSKVTAAEVIEMRSLFAKGVTAREIAERYDLSRQQVYRIRSGQSWQHIADVA